MGLFDKIKANAVSKDEPKPQASATFVFAALPESLDEMKTLPEAALDTPFKTAALTICALCAYAADKTVGKEMLNFLRGPEPLSNHDISFLNDRFTDKNNLFVPFSYFDGAVPGNDYTPSEPFTLKITTNPYSFQNEGYATVLLTSGGADSPRQIKLRQKGNQWFLTEQFVMVGIRQAKSLDPWA